MRSQKDNTNNIGGNSGGEGRVGYVYILTNPSIPGALKIGMSSNHPLYRSWQLSGSTGIPTPFHVAYYRSFSDCPKAEAIAHKALEQHRISLNREFFNVGLEEAISVVDNIADDADQFNSQRYVDNGMARELPANYFPPAPFAELFATFAGRAEGDEYENVLAPDEIAQCRELEERLAETKRRNTRKRGARSGDWRVAWEE